ncbi:hypothetical protein ACWDRR_37985 [Kitasatospora sp. NPDC003701]
MTVGRTPGEPTATAFGRGAAWGGPRGGHASGADAAARPGLSLVVTDRFTPDPDEQERQDARERHRLRLHIGPGERCVLRFPLPAPPPPPPRTTKDDTVRTGDIDLPAEHRHVLEQAFGAARRHDLALAVQRTDHLLITLAASYGARHRFTLTAAQVRADLAWLSGDAWCAAKLWTLISDGWARLEGPASRPARFGARQAAASWREVPDDEAAAVGAALLATLLTVAPHPESNSLVLAVRRRLGRIAGLPC